MLRCGVSVRHAPLYSRLNRPTIRHRLCIASPRQHLFRERVARLARCCSTPLDSDTTSQLDTSTTEDHVETTEEASRRVLEWPELCHQVACFTATAMGADEIRQNGLHLSSSPEETELLLQQTAEALAVEIDFGGVHDLRLGLDTIAANERHVFTATQLCLIGVTIRNAKRIYERLERNLASAPVLHDISKSLVLPDDTLFTAIQRCIRDTDGYVFDEASEELRKSRSERLRNAEELKTTSEHWAQQLFREGICERPIVVFRRDRRCIPVRNGRQGLLPKYRSVRLAQSATGATVYMEPEPIVELNNQDARLHNQIRHHERRIFVALSKLVRSKLPELKAMMHVLKLLDVIHARARHAQWCGGGRPRFVSDCDDWQVCIPGAVHPLLLEQSLDPLPNPATESDMIQWRTPQAFLENPPRPLALQSIEEVEETPFVKRPRPQSLELTIPRNKTVITLTGPNTGGKTATLKTLGLSVMMAKAGLYVPLEADPSRASIDVHLKWFDKVLADIGDSQSLQQSLSTFSGHVRRITHVRSPIHSPIDSISSSMQIMDEVCGNSLVLLDEIGTGTDPTEGAALAGAILSELSEIAGLTVATSHHAEIKELAEGHELFLNASMEFDAALLKPTYRLIWGSTGLSNALDICTALNFDPDVVDEARAILKTGILKEEQLANVEETLRKKLAEAIKMRDALLKTKKKAKSKLKDLEQQLKKTVNEEKNLEKRIQEYQTQPREADGEVDWILNEVKSGELTFAEAEECFKELRNHAPHPEDDPSVKGLMWYPERDEVVKLRHLGGRYGRVLSDKRGKTVRIQCQNMVFTVPVWHIAQVDPNEIPKEFQSTDTLKPTRKPATASIGSFGEVNFERLRTRSNTLDLRGMYVEDAMESVQSAIETRTDTDVLFIIHGIGTGRLKAAVREYIKQSSRVREYTDDPDSAGDCTIVILRP